jgi:hypothetical protein
MKRKHTVKNKSPTEEIQINHVAEDKKKKLVLMNNSQQRLWINGFINFINSRNNNSIDKK